VPVNLFPPPETGEGKGGGEGGEKGSQTHGDEGKSENCMILSPCLSTCLYLVSVLCSAINRKVYSPGHGSILRAGGW